MNPTQTSASLRLCSTLILLCTLCVSTATADPASYKPSPDDILIADFEGDSYGDWKVEGEAFGERPAVANVRPANKVTGHQGKGLVNTFLGGDAPVGKLTSPEFTIERNHINFLIGAGRHEGKTCMNLLVDGKVVRAAVGPATKNLDGQEVMDWASWDVEELKGKKAMLQIVDDLIHWRDLPYAIYPNPERACFSGSAMVEKDRVIAMYHGTTVGSMVAVSDDPLLLNWEKVTGKAVIPHSKPGEPKLPYNVFDPCIWKQGEYYYALTAGRKPTAESGKPVRAEFLHRSKDLAKWEYLHTFLEGDHYGLVGDDGACPYFWPIGDKHILLHFSHMSGGKYLLGNYDTERDKFVVTDGGDFNHGPVAPGGVHAPSAAPDGEGGVITIFNMNPAKATTNWNQIMTLPMRLTLAPPGELDPLRIEPAGDIQSLRGEHRHIDTMTLPANEEIVLENIQGNSMEIIAEIDPQGVPMVELKVLRSPNSEEFTRITFQQGRGYRRSSTITIDNSRSSVLPDVSSRVPESAQFTLGQGEPLRLHVFIDRSVVEVFANGRQYAALRVYPGRDDSLGVSLRAQGRDCVLKSLDAWQMKSIYLTGAK